MGSLPSPASSDRGVQHATRSAHLFLSGMEGRALRPRARGVADSRGARDRADPDRCAGRRKLDRRPVRHDAGDNCGQSDLDIRRRGLGSRRMARVAAGPVRTFRLKIRTRSRQRPGLDPKNNDSQRRPAGAARARQNQLRYALPRMSRRGVACTRQRPAANGRPYEEELPSRRDDIFEWRLSPQSGGESSAPNRRRRGPPRARRENRPRSRIASPAPSRAPEQSPRPYGRRRAGRAR